MRHNRHRFCVPQDFGQPGTDPPDADAARYVEDSAAAVVRDALDLLANRPPFDRLADAEWREQAGKLVGAALATRPPPDLGDVPDTLLVELRANPVGWSCFSDPDSLRRAVEAEMERRVEAEHEAAGAGRRELARSA